MGKTVGGGGLGGGGPGGGAGPGGGNVGGGKSTGSGGKTERYRDPDLGGQVTSWGAPIHTNMTPGPGQGIQTARDRTSWSVLNQQINTYNSAARKWNASASKPSIANLINNLAPFGLSMEAPKFGKPKTYAGGDYHLGLNPGAAIGGLASFAIPGLGIPASSLLGAAYSASGLDDVMLGGPGVPSNWRVWSGAGVPTVSKSSKSSPGRGASL